MSAEKEEGEKNIGDLLLVDDRDEKLYDMVSTAKKILKAARLCKIATQERIDAETVFKTAQTREEAAVASLSRLILTVQ